MTSPFTLSFTGASGKTYEFFGEALTFTPAPVGGIYVIARKLAGPESNEALQVLYIGQTDDFALSAAGFRENEDFSKDPDLLFCLHLEDDDAELRTAICEDLRKRYLRQKTL